MSQSKISLQTLKTVRNREKAVADFWQPLLAFYNKVGSEFRREQQIPDRTPVDLRYIY